MSWAESGDIRSTKLPAVRETNQPGRSVESIDMLSAMYPRKDSKFLKLEQEHDRLLNDYSALKAENKHLADQKTDAEADSQSLRTRVMTLQQELAACKDDLFRVQPSVPIPDTEIQSDYESISQQIVNWIDEEIRNFEKAHPETPTDTFYSSGDHSGIARLLKRYPDAGEYLVRQRIHKYLQDRILHSNIYLLGLPVDIGEALQAAERSMAGSNPPKDTASINTWRAETLSALAATTTFSKLRDGLIDDVTMDLFESLSKIFPIVRQQRASINRLYWQVIQPAAKLAVKIQTSVSTYKFRGPVSRNPFVYCRVDVLDLQSNKFIDISTNKTLRPGSAVSADKDGGIGETLICLERSLVRLDLNQKDIELRKAVYLMELDEPVRKRV